MNSKVPESPEEGSLPLYRQMGFDNEEDHAAFEAMLDAVLETQWHEVEVSRLAETVEQAHNFVESYWTNGQRSFSDQSLTEIRIYLEWLRAFPEIPS